LIPIFLDGKLDHIEGALVPIAKGMSSGHEENFSLLFQNVPVGVFRTSFEGKLLRANPALVEMLGYASEEELLSVPVSNHYVDPSVRESVLREIGKGKEIKNRELKLKRKDGEIITVLEDSYAVKSPTGKPLFFEGILVNITELKNTQEKIRKSEEEKRFLLDSVEESVSFQDRERRILWANKSALRDLNLSLEEIQGKICYEIWYGASSPCRDCPVEEALKTGEFKFAEVRSQNGRIWLTRAVPVKNEEGEVIGVVDLSLDITKLKKSEEELRESQAFLYQLLSESPVGVSVRKGSGELIFVNEAWKKFWGLSEEQIRALEEKTRGQSFLERFKYLEEFRPQIEKLLEEGGSLWLPEVQIFGTGIRDGAWVSLHFYTLKDKEGKVTRIVTLVEDITKEKRAEEEINKAKMDFLYSVSHELKTPLLALSTTLEMILLAPAQEKLKALEEYSSIFKRNIERLMSLVESLIDSQKTLTKGILLDFKAIDLKELLNETLLDFQASIKAKELRVEINAEENFPKIECDSEAIKKCFSNLISNAIKFSPIGGKVEISLTRSREFAEISIKDQGIGIPDQELKSLFVPFSRGHNAQSAKIPGAGLGLYVSKVLVEKHGGRINLESAPGKGTTATIMLPIFRKRIL